MLKYCQHLKVDHDGADPLSLQPTVRAWWESPDCPLHGVPWLLVWAEFIDTWPRVKYAAGQLPIDAAVKLALQEPDYPCLVQYEHDRLQALAKIYACLDKLKPKTETLVWLPVRTAGELLGVSPEDAARLTRMLVAEKLLTLVSRGKGSRASRYRWNGEAGRVLPGVVVDVREDDALDW